MGNPLTSENSAFRWLIAVLIAAISVGIVARVFGPTPGILYGLVLLAIVSVIIAKGMVHLLGNPNKDQPTEDENGAAAPGRTSEASRPPVQATNPPRHPGRATNPPATATPDDEPTAAPKSGDEPTAAPKSGDEPSA